MNQRCQQVLLYWKSPVRRLHPIGPAYPLNLSRELSLRFRGAHVFDHRIRERNIEAPVGKWQAASISKDEPRPVVIRFRSPG